MYNSLLLSPNLEIDLLEFHEVVRNKCLESEVHEIPQLLTESLPKIQGSWNAAGAAFLLNFEICFPNEVAYRKNLHIELKNIFNIRAVTFK
jgi:hypothetical protein